MPPLDPGLDLDIDHSIFDTQDPGHNVGPTVERYPGASRTYSAGKTFMDRFDSDEHADKQATNLYYPFASRDKWDVGSFLLRSGLLMVLIDQFLKLLMVSSNIYIIFLQTKEYC